MTPDTTAEDTAPVELPDEALATAQAGAAAIRALIDPMSGRIDNWSQR